MILKIDSSMIVTMIFRGPDDSMVVSTVVARPTVEWSFKSFLSPEHYNCCLLITPSKAPAVLLGTEAAEDALELSGEVLHLHASASQIAGIMLHTEFRPFHWVT